MSIFWVLAYAVVALLLLTVGLVFIIHRPRSVLVRVLCGLLAAAVGWLWSVSLVFTLADHSNLILAARSTFVFAEFIPVFAFLFVFLFPESHQHRRSRTVIWSVLLWGFLVAMLTMTTDVIVDDLRVLGIERAWAHGSGYRWLFVGHYAAFSAMTLGLLLRRISQLVGDQRRFMLVYAVGWAAAVIFGSLTNIVLPNLGYHTSYIGPLASLFHVLAMVYVLIRSEVASIRIISTEIFVIAFASFQAIGFVLATSRLHMVIALFSVMLSVLTGSLILLGLRRDREQRQALLVLTDELEETNQQLRDMAASRSEFVSIISHQLRTPVSIVKGYLSLIRDGAYGQVGGVLREKVDQIFEMNERLVHLIGNLLNLTRLERGHLEFDCSEIDLQPLILKSIDEMMVEINDKGLQLDFVEPKQSLPKVWVDPDKLHEVLINLIDNSIKYTSSGTVTITAEIDPQHSQQVLVRVQDTGIGMRPEDLEHVFEKFFQPQDKEDAVRQAGRRMGLGLFICAKFMRGMGGNIWVEQTVPGQGTTMAVAIPVEPGGACAVDPSSVVKLPNDPA